jgi:hypothetical protein
MFLVYALAVVGVFATLIAFVNFLAWVIDLHDSVRKLRQVEAERNIFRNRLEELEKTHAATKEVLEALKKEHEPKLLVD